MELSRMNRRRRRGRGELRGKIKLCSDVSVASAELRMLKRWGICLKKAMNTFDEF